MERVKQPTNEIKTSNKNTSPTLGETHAISTDLHSCPTPRASIFILYFNIVYTGCNRRNGPDFGRVFLMLNYTEKPQSTYIQSSMVTEI